MPVTQTFLGVFVLVASGIAFPQANDATHLEQLEKPAAEDQHRASSIINPCQARATGEVEILTDTMGVDFGPYLTGVAKVVRQFWYEILPPSVYPPTQEQGKVSIEFLINKDGKVKSMKMQTTSSDAALDRAAWGSIGGSRFGPLPAAFPGRQIGLVFNFYYNLEKSSISIAPCVDVKVPAGATVQFSASVEGIAGNSVNWNVSGPGCSRLACGTISKNGLYTAPKEIPNPPTIVVEAKVWCGFSAKAKLTVVEATPSH